MMNSLLTAGLTVLAASVLTQSPESAPIQAAAVTRTGQLQFSAAVDKVFPLFTPQGERHWAQGWEPEIVYPKDVAIAEGMVFRTTQNGAPHIWTVTRYEPAAHSVAYNVVAPGMLVRQIAVRCRPAGPHRTDVTVTDSYIALSADGKAFITNLDQPAYAKKMAHWQAAIDAYLRGAANRK